MSHRAGARGGRHALTRFNAAKHGILSKHTVLHWEQGSEYQALHESLRDEYAPRATTEAYLVAELAGIIWRKRRVRQAEAAIALDPAYPDMSSIEDPVAGHGLEDIIKKNENGDIVDLNNIRKRKEIVLSCLNITKENGDDNYDRALSLLPADLCELWDRDSAAPATARDATIGGAGAGHAVVSRPETEAAEESRYYERSAAGLGHWLKEAMVPCLEEEERMIPERRAVRARLVATAVSGPALETVARYERHLDRKFERTLAMLLRLRDLRPPREADPPPAPGA